MITEPMTIGTIISPPGILSMLRLMGICMWWTNACSLETRSKCSSRSGRERSFQRTKLENRFCIQHQTLACFGQEMGFAQIQFVFEFS